MQAMLLRMTSSLLEVREVLVPRLEFGVRRSTGDTDAEALLLRLAVHRDCEEKDLPQVISVVQ